MITPQLQKELERHAGLGDGPSPAGPESWRWSWPASPAASTGWNGARGMVWTVYAGTWLSLLLRTSGCASGWTSWNRAGWTRSRLLPRGDGTTRGSGPAIHPVLDRRYPQLVTEEAEAGEERVYRDASAPDYAEWRSQRRELPRCFGR